jgi:hypothetical protein
VFLPGDPAPERWTVSVFPLDAVISGVVLDPDGGPIVGARILTLQFEQATSDSAGHFRVPAASHEEFGAQFAIVVSAVGFVSVQTPVELRAGETQLRDIVLVPESAVRGRVVDESGIPVADAEVRGQSEWGTHTREDGSFELGGPGIQEESLTLLVTKDGFVQYREVPREARGTDIEIRLERGASIAGRVVSESERTPIWGAWVSLDGPLEAEGDSTLSKRDGGFVLTNVRPGKHRLWVHRLGHAMTRVQCDVGRGSAPLEVECALADDHFIGGVLHDEQGRPAPWKEIEVWDATRFFDFYARIHSGPDGRFRVVDLPDREVNLRVFSAGLARFNEIVSGLDRDDLVLQLKPTFRLAGRVMDAATQAPVSSFTVRVGSPPSEFEDPDAERSNVGFNPPARSFSNSDGAWTIEAPGGPGTAVSLQIDSEGYVPAKVEMVRASSTSSPDDLVIRLARTTLVHGRVIAKESGVPLEGARLLRLTAGQQLQIVENSREPSPQATSDAAGRFELTGVPTGEMFLAVEVPGRATVLDGPFIVAAIPIERTIEVGLGATLLGRLLDPAGNGLGEEKVSLEAYDGYQKEKEWEATTDSEGRFRFAAMAPGSYGLTWNAYRGEERILGLHEQVEIVAEETWDTVLQRSGRATLSGTLDFEGDLPERHWVWIEPVTTETMDPSLARWAHTSWSVPTRGRRFELEYLEPGEYEVSYECDLGRETEGSEDMDDMFEDVVAYGQAHVIVPAEGSVEVHLTLERHEF